MNETVLFVCAECRQKLRAGLRIEALTGDPKPEKDECAFCHRRCYGDWVRISYRKRGEKSA